jgi:alpha-tubulin suppressor-like RCC1 family protein
MITALRMARRAFLVPTVLAVAIGCDGDPSPSNIEPDTVTAAPAGFFSELSAGYYHACGLTGAGNVYCWGWGHGVHGVNSASLEEVGRPLRVTGLTAQDTLSSGANASCVLDGGIASCWGENEYGQMGTTETTARCGVLACNPAPLPVDADITFQQIGVGGGHTCGIDVDGVAYCWGYAAFGRLGVIQTTNQRTPIAVNTTLRFRSVGAGGTQSCGIAVDGRAYCWGYGEGGQLGNGTQAATQGTPALVSGDRFYSQLSVGALHTCALATDGAIWCWGVNSSGQLGNSSTSNASVPVRAGTLTFRAVAAGGEHTCGIAQDDRAYCWGNNAEGQLGDSTSVNRSAPTLVVGDLRFRTLSAGYHYTCGITTTDLTYCWGYNYRGGLGIGLEDLFHPVPRRVAAPLS